MQKNNTLISFIGPLPPPIGGVAVMNQNIQTLFTGSYNIEYFNTARSRLREDMYGRKNISDVCAQLKVIQKGISFLFRTKSKIVNIFVTSNASFLRELIFIVVAAILRKKIVVHLHSKIEGELFLRKYLINIFGITLCIANKVLVLSELHFSYFSNYIKESKLEILENFVYIDRYRSARKREGLNILYVGRTTKEKGIYDLIDAVCLMKCRISDMKIHVIGMAETEQLEKKLNATVRTNEVEEFFIFHGALSGEPKYQLFQDCSVLVFPSHFENSPLVLKEALAAKQIIVCSDLLANKKCFKKYFE